MGQSKNIKIREILAGSGGEWVNLPSLLPASIVLEMAGESLRSRLYFAMSPDGEELCLRADLTIAAALKYLNEAKNTAVTYLCEGTVFRASPAHENRAVEFNQIGIEKFGPQDEIAVDVEVFLAALGTAQTGKKNELAIEFSDGGLIPKLLDGAHIPEPWNQYLLDVAKSPQALRRALAFACNPKKPPPTELGMSLLKLDDDAATAEVQKFIENADFQTGFARGPREIAQRMKASTQRAIATPLDIKFSRAIDELLAIDDFPVPAIAKIKNIAKQLNEDLSNWADAWAKRLKLMEKATPGIMENTKIIVGKSGRFEYYSGFNFDIFYSNQRETPIASGGRYDGLIAALTKGRSQAQAMGVVIRPERIVDTQ
ncbi:MAG: ATP phosphoribosyltransferase regulatory subunit [Hyphomonadaceae bacterium]|nr:MAG: ATP phosphoribosyltransferase regulatory subunit [Hyphomonadaceae bacterium]KAF0184860.1 MAG: ATP phosphoribosyltransferase regulatory subunit [Hyphomonadaceae bacterium]